MRKEKKVLVSLFCGSAVTCQTFDNFATSFEIMGSNKGVKTLTGAYHPDLCSLMPLARKCCHQVAMCVPMSTQLTSQYGCLSLPFTVYHELCWPGYSQPVHCCLPLLYNFDQFVSHASHGVLDVPKYEWCHGSQAELTKCTKMSWFLSKKPQKFSENSQHIARASNNHWISTRTYRDQMM